VKRKISVCVGNRTPTARARRQSCGSCIGRSYCVKYGASILLIFFEDYITFTDEELITARKERDTHDQYFLVNNELLLPIVKTFAVYSLTARHSKYLGVLSCVK
jgi:hypothetical protein